MEKRAETYINHVLKQEGYWVCDKDDIGGETYRGISRKAHPNWPGWKIVDAHKPLKKNQKIDDPELEANIIEFYYEKYYAPSKAHLINNNVIAAHVFDHSVNAGIKAGAKILQKAINAVTHKGIAVDGIIGNITLSFANNAAYSDRIAKEIASQRNAFYTNIVEKNKTQAKFLNGWLNRVKNTTKMAEAYVEPIVSDPEPILAENEDDKKKVCMNV